MKMNYELLEELLKEHDESASMPWEAYEMQTKEVLCWNR